MEIHNIFLNKVNITNLIGKSKKYPKSPNGQHFPSAKPLCSLVTHWYQLCNQRLKEQL